MNNEIEGYAERNEKNVLTLIQYKCKCGNFEEIKPVNNDYRLKNFHVYSVISDESHPLRYICKKCNIERKQIRSSDTPLSQ